VNPMAGRAVALIGAVLAIVGLFVSALPGESYWDLDGTLSAFGLAVAILAVLCIAASYRGLATDGWLAGLGALMVGYWGWFPAATAFDDWDQTRAGVWLTFAGGILVLLGAAAAIQATGGARSTPAGLSPAALAAGIGIALVFPGIFLDAESGQSYWDGPLGHSLGIVMLVVAVVAGLVWAASSAGTGTRGLDVAVSLILLGLVAFDPIGAAFNNLGDLDAGAWLALAGGILAAGGTWAARGIEMPHAAPSPA
jgi:uncharacterized membrane protein